MNFSSMNKQRTIIFFTALLGVISVFLPWITISIMGMGESTNGFRGAGIVVFLSFAASAIIAIVGNQENKLDKQMWLAALIAGAISFLFVIISFGSSSGDSMGFVESGYGIGIWIALFSSIGVLAAVWFLKDPDHNLKSSIDSFRISPISSTANMRNNIPELEKLIELKNQGKISEEEYQQLKSKII